ncbi:hypothetical protein B0T10DRAFT_562757 [Thelonectria olida]|uniref:Uncharacterized protein n=1 Tax=Thelonectria olida TaxID=1576542 RepID=A0A9P8W193_9HYPO|nr:hypothetical protein B0T10DRAFT_562757 [Thelonectria olida]
MNDFFDQEAPAYFREYNVLPTQITTLKRCVNGNITPRDAAKQLTAYPEAAPTPLEMQQRLAGLWTLLNDTAVLVPSAQTTILSILKIIRTLPPVKEPTGEGEGLMDLDDGDIWCQLSGWGSDLADSLNSWAVRVDREKSPAYRAKYDRVTRKAHWISASAYVGRLASTGDELLTGVGGFLRFMSFIIVRALENELNETDPDSNVGGKLEPPDLEAMAQLFVHAAPELYRLCKDRHISQLVRLSKGKLWHGEGNCDYSLERWAFWRERWIALANTESLSGNARQAAREATEAMEKAKT